MLCNASYTSVSMGPAKKWPFLSVRHGQMMGDAFSGDHRSALLWLWGYAQKREGSEVIVWGKNKSLHLSNLKRIMVTPNERGILWQFLHPREMLRRPKLENSALLLVSQRLSGSFVGCQKPDAPGPCLTYLGTSCPIWSLLWTGQRPKADLVHPRSSSRS